MKDIEEKPIAQIIFSGMYGVDTFFVMRYKFLNSFLLNAKINNLNFGF